MDLASLLIFAGALLVNAGTPGPSIAALIGRVLTRGPGSVLPFLAAMWIGEGIWLTAAVFGLSYLAATFHAVFAAIKYLGAAYLLFLAWKMWTAPVRLESKPLPEAGSVLALFGGGMAVTIGNPKIMGFYLALLPSLFDFARIGLVAWAELVAVMLLVLVAVDLGWLAAASYARRWIRSPRAVRLSNRVGATAMGGAAVALAAR